MPKLAKMATVGRRLLGKAAGATIDVVATAGAGLISYGAEQIYRPAGFIVAGTLILVGAWLYARKAA